MRWILAHRVMARFPTLRCHPTAIWDFGYQDLDAIQLGTGVSVLAFASIVVYKHSPRSPHEGRLLIGDDAVVAEGAIIRAAGGTIRIGRGSGIGQYGVVVAANHTVRLGVPVLSGPWETVKSGVDIGDNVWLGAHCVVLPGVRIGDNSAIAAGSVVSHDVPPNEIWGGVPARKIKDVPGPRS
ncbi:MAG TPA: acyltransferase [Gemmatimonadales bacterium]|nr:acyltransferase [Gemmatimonadales bacterium]